MRTIYEEIWTSTNPAIGLGHTTFLWGSMANINRDLTFIDPDSLYPVCCMVPDLISIQPNPKGVGVAKKMYIKYVSILLFLSSSEFLGDQNTKSFSAVEAMKEEALKFLSKLELYIAQNFKDTYSQVALATVHSLNPYDKDDYSAYFNQFDTNTDGVGVTIELDLLQTYVDCVKGI